MKKNILAICLCMVAPAAIAQIPNAGFNSWSPSGKPAPFDWEEPDNWTSTNSVTEFIAAGITKSTDMHEGAYAAKIAPVNVFGTQRVGMLCLGKPEVDFSNYSVNLGTGGVPFTTRPATLNGFYKLPGSGLSNGTVGVMLTRYNGISGKRDTLAASIKFLPVTDTYTPFTLNIFYTDPRTPDTLTIYIISDPDLPLYVDALSFSTGTGTADAESQILQMYPNPAHHMIHFAEKDDYTLYDLSGRTLMEVTQTKSMQVDQLPAGSYFVKSRNGGRGKLVLLN